MTIYLISDVGSVGGGWISSRLLHSGHSVNTSRKTSMLLCALTVVPIVFAYRIGGMWSAVFVIGLAAAGHQGFAANLFTLPPIFSLSRQWVLSWASEAWQARSAGC